MKSIIILLLVIMLGTAAEYDRITVLRWAGPDGTRPETYEEWIALHPVEEFYHCVQNVLYGDGRQGDIHVRFPSGSGGAAARRGPEATACGIS